MSVLTEAEMADRGFQGLVWTVSDEHETYTATHAGSTYTLVRYMTSSDYSERKNMYALCVTLPDGRKVHRIYKGLGTAKGCATKLAQVYQWRYR